MKSPRSVGGWRSEHDKTADVTPSAMPDSKIRQLPHASFTDGTQNGGLDRTFRPATGMIGQAVLSGCAAVVERGGQECGARMPST